MDHNAGIRHHPIIGQVEGAEVDGVIQFRGVQYGVLDHWLDKARLPTYDGIGVVATKHGPHAISNPGGLDVEHQIIQKALPRPEDPGASATQCLNLNLTIPTDADASSQLPVLVFIHGGGFFAGANWWPQYDTRSIVQLSIAQGKPIIAANINYRLGMPGFLTSRELRDAGFQSNNGHHDQRTAFRWLRKYVAGFGGDPERITAAGESIGGLSVLRLLHPDENLASRLVVLAGAPPLMNPRPLETAEATYSTIVEALAVDGRASPQGRITALINTPPEVLAAKIDPRIMFSPLVDGDLIESEPTFEAINTRPPWKNTSCKAVMVGFSPFDASVLGLMGLFERKKGIAAAFADYVRSSLVHHAAEAEKLLQVYGIEDGARSGSGSGANDEDDSDEVALIRILQFASDIGYRAPAHALARTFPGDSFLLQFREPNPWDGGPFKGYTTHVLDVAFLFQNYNEHLDAKQQATAVQFAQDVILFAHGAAAPWDVFRTSDGMAVYENGTRTYKPGRDMATKEYDGLLEIGAVVGLDSLAKIVEGFVFGP